ncbi:MAG: hypothetical protein OEZ36_00530 [Spirochaetota bacterium]|nr:hypothetical protein [Spirochaetota bacterium]
MGTVPAVPIPLIWGRVVLGIIYEKQGIDLGINMPLISGGMAGSPKDETVLTTMNPSLNA